MQHFLPKMLHLVFERAPGYLSSDLFNPFLTMISHVASLVKRLPLVIHSISLLHAVV